jgi:hypothetical protein
MVAKSCLFTCELLLGQILNVLLRRSWNSASQAIEPSIILLLG